MSYNNSWRVPRYLIVDLIIDPEEKFTFKDDPTDIDYDNCRGGDAVIVDMKTKRMCREGKWEDVRYNRTGGRRDRDFRS